jgi:hypothetical protein
MKGCGSCMIYTGKRVCTFKLTRVNLPAYNIAHKKGRVNRLPEVRTLHKTKSGTIGAAGLRRPPTGPAAQAGRCWRTPRALLRSDQVYWILLRAYPLRFHQRFAPEMAQVFRICCREVYALSGNGGSWRLWLSTLWD